MATPAHHTKIAGHTAAVDANGNVLPVLSLDLGPRLSLIIHEASRDLEIRDIHAQSSRSCGTVLHRRPPVTRRIPLYNILWARITSITLEIDFAEETGKSKHKKIVPAILSFPLVFPSVAGHQPNIPECNAFINTLLSQAYGQATRAKRAYVIINPHAGPGGADKKYEKEVKPIFEAARMQLTVETTANQGDAVGMCRDMDINAHDLVVACSGDGLPHECFNGLAQRADAKRALGRMPVVMIPCGSGNAMACNLYGTHKPSLSALAIVKGVPTPLDLASITQGNRRTLSFLSQAFGLVADLDLGTEHLRWMGSTRFSVGFMWLVFQKRMYPCDIAMKVEIEGKAAVKLHYQERMAGPEEGQALPPAASPQASPAALGTIVEAGDNGLPLLRYGTARDKVPGDWETIPHEKLGNFYCGNMAYMAPDANFFPAAMANDGLMDMVTVDGDISPFKAIEMQVGVENGHFFDNPLVTYRKVSAYRITPRDTDKAGHISIDGESVPFEAFQAEVHPALGLTLSKTGAFEAPGPKDWDAVTRGERLLA